MVKHTQTIRRQFAEELFKCVWPFCWIGAQRVRSSLISKAFHFGLIFTHYFRTCRSPKTVDIRSAATNEYCASMAVESHQDHSINQDPPSVLRNTIAIKYSKHITKKRDLTVTTKTRNNDKFSDTSVDLINAHNKPNQSRKSCKRIFLK